jgi:hypothetical protein
MTETPLRLYLVHCGFYDPALAGGLYESHVNYLIPARSFPEAKARTKELPEYRERKMHVDGIEELQAVHGFRIHLREDPALRGASESRRMGYKELQAVAP